MKDKKNVKSILILVDDRNQFYSSTKEPGGSMNVDVIKKELEYLGYSVIIKGFSEVEFRGDLYKDFFVLYQSTEDPDLRYKDYIEDILLGLKMSGARLIPRFEYFRAHHNKVFMEILREKMNYGEHIKSLHFGTFEELAKSEYKFSYPVVVKPGVGSRSRGIFLARNRKQLLKTVWKISSSFTFINTMRFLKSVFSLKSFKPISNNRKKFIIQEFISGLSGDYKVLVYGDKYYVVRRENRSRDFRASGSGLLSFPKIVPDGLLDYAQLIFKKSRAPFMGMDVACLDGRFYLIEFLCP